MQLNPLDASQVSWNCPLFNLIGVSTLEPRDLGSVLWCWQLVSARKEDSGHHADVMEFRLIKPKAIFTGGEAGSWPEAKLSTRDLWKIGTVTPLNWPQSTAVAASLAGHSKHRLILASEFSL
jgi:hypothetical protein